jgi:hypothetical protein
MINVRKRKIKKASFTYTYMSATSSSIPKPTFQIAKKFKEEAQFFITEPSYQASYQTNQIDPFRAPPTFTSMNGLTVMGRAASAYGAATGKVVGTLGSLSLTCPVRSHGPEYVYINIYISRQLVESFYQNLFLQPVAR